MSKEASGVTVRVLGSEYVIAAPPDQRAELLACAGHLNDRLREQARGGRVVGNDRLLVVVALNLVHELMQARTALSEQATTLQRLVALEARLSSALHALEPAPQSG
ncbi:cell division protein ZapA [Immundisolibacter sp.]|uniref:cell division protein ZapA n=1 Tax=Immundisolibacter sp. TaxID=1934948 RepID=UPI003561B9B2